MTLFERFLCLFFKHYDIKKVIDGQEVVYLRRFFIWRPKDKSKGGSVFLHHIINSDDDPDPHDHPFDFTSIILRGGYHDERWWWWNMEGTNSPSHRFGPIYEEVRPLTVVRRHAEHIHRVRLHPKRSAWTLVFTGPYRREWNFITKTGFVHWRKYMGFSDSDVYEGD
jgi:hypothetical protein